MSDIMANKPLLSTTTVMIVVLSNSLSFNIKIHNFTINEPPGHVYNPNENCVFISKIVLP